MLVVLPLSHRRRLAATAAFAISFGAALCTRLAAQIDLMQVAAKPVQYRVEEWGTGNGMPQNTALAILQAGNGPLWIATFGGLCRYDGERFEVFDTVTGPGLRTNRFTCLHEGPDGTLWIGTELEGLASYRNGRFRMHPELPRDTVTNLCVDANGRLLVATPNRLFRQDGAQFVPLHAAQLTNVTGLLRRRSGEMLAANAAGVWSLDGDSARLLAQGPAHCLAELGDRLHVGTNRGLFRLLDDQLTPWQPTPQLTEPIHALLAASDGTLWVGTGYRAIRIDGAELADASPRTYDPTRTARLVSVERMQVARALCEDSNGGIWVGHTAHGLSRLRQVEVLHHATGSGLPPRGIVAVLGDGRGGLFVGTTSGLLRGTPGNFARVVGATELGSNRGLCSDQDGGFWLGTAKGLARLDDRGAQILIDQTLWPASRSGAIVGEPGGGCWLGGESGLRRMTDRTLSTPPVAEPWQGQLVRSLVQAPDGALWVGGASMLARIDAARTSSRIWRSGVELPFGEVRAILPEAGEHAWIATYGGGVVRIDGSRCRAIDERHGLRNQSLCAMVAFGEDYFLASNLGVCVARRKDLEAVAEGHQPNLACRTLISDGEHVDEIDGGMQPCATVANGSIWFCGIQGLLEVDPTRLQPLRRQLTTTLQSLFVGDQHGAIEPGATVTAEARVASFRLGTCDFDHYAQVRYRWRLLGRSPTWSEPSYEREVRVDQLPTGNLVFEAEAIDLDGRPGGRPVRVLLQVPPRLWETGAFWLVLPVVMFGIAALLVRFGASRAARYATRLQRVVEARTSELNSARELLEHRVAERTGELQAAMQQQRDDMQARQRLERQLQQLQRMESLGQLAGGIAHDFNNLLMVASGSSQLLADEVQTAEGQELCRSIRLACERGRGLTQHLLAVASRQLVTVARLDLNTGVRDLLPVLRSLLGNDTPVEFTPAAAEAPVRAALTQIEQILLNLAANARDAMPRGGRVAIRITSSPDEVQVELQDTGDGMPPEVQERVFEPFFTTKHHGIGRGLGLATVYGIVKQLGGDIHIDSAVAVGTTFRITLPRARDADQEPTVEIPTAPPQTLQGTILLVEDEADVRAVLERLLRSLGCTVRSAVDGTAAVAALRADPTAIDAVVSDVVMPGLQGRQLVLALRALRPDLPIVFLSGYLDGRLTHQDLHEMGLEILQKPVDAPDLAKVLQRLLRRPEVTPSPAPPAPGPHAPTAAGPPPAGPRSSASHD